jgi:hypothetical protein
LQRVAGVRPLNGEVSFCAARFKKLDSKAISLYKQEINGAQHCSPHNSKRDKMNVVTIIVTLQGLGFPFLVDC